MCQELKREDKKAKNGSGTLKELFDFQEYLSNFQIVRVSLKWSSYFSLCFTKIFVKQLCQSTLNYVKLKNVENQGKLPLIGVNFVNLF